MSNGKNNIQCKEKAKPASDRPSDDQLAQCYGKECLHCRKPCALRECGIDVIREKQDVLAISNGRKDIVSMHDIEMDLPAANRFTRKKNNQNVLDALNQVAFLYLDYPKVFDGLMRRIYLGQNQAQIARERGLTRAAISKELREGVFNMMTRELGIKTPVAKRENLLKLTAREFEVYKLSSQGCSEREIAERLGASKSTIHRVGQVLRGKLAKNGTAKNTVGMKNSRAKIES